jgi:hypothetical protein
MNKCCGICKHYGDVNEFGYGVCLYAQNHFPTAIAKNRISYRAGEKCPTWEEKKPVERCCGTCKYWKESETIETTGSCSYDITIKPASVVKSIMSNFSGTSCPCWENRYHE